MMSYLYIQNPLRKHVCMKCRSFVSHEKREDGLYICPLCGHSLPPTPRRVPPISLQEFREMVANFHRNMKTEDPNQGSIEAALDASRVFVENTPLADDLEHSLQEKKKTTVSNEEETTDLKENDDNTP